MVASPTTSLMCAKHADGACAIILASEEKAREITDKPIFLSGIGTSSYATNRGESAHLGRLMGTHIAARRAYEMAGLSEPMNDFDLAQVHDLISGLEIVACEELGFCEPGQGGECLERGEFSAGGRLPVNIDGGRIGCGHAPAVSGLYAACEIVRQLREEAGTRQVALRKGRGVMQCTDSHGGMNSVSVFERE
jgi:acetyl-CoA acetyltransferase